MIQDPTSQVTWQWRRPAAAASSLPGGETSPWLAELSEMRGRVLYAGGRRPAFRSGDGRCVDRDRFDPVAHHLLVRVRGALAGCLRIVPFTSATTSTETLLGPAGLRDIIGPLGLGREDCGEASRWIVAPEHRGYATGIRLVAGTFALARRLRLRVVVATVGTRDGQRTALERAGGLCVPGFEAIPSARFDDELCVMAFDTDRPNRAIQRLVQDMASRLEPDHSDAVSGLPRPCPRATSRVSADPRKSDARRPGPRVWTGPTVESLRHEGV
jgi:hypothetical protein